MLDTVAHFVAKLGSRPRSTLTRVVALLMWAVATFWREGRGTPVPLAAPQRLVTSGPFASCRNPIELGACTAYLGIATLAVSLAAGVLAFGVAVALGSAYRCCRHRHHCHNDQTAPAHARDCRGAAGSRPAPGDAMADRRPWSQLAVPS